MTPLSELSVAAQVVDVALDVFESGCPHACAPLELLPRALLLLGAMGGHVDLPGGRGVPL